MKYESWEKWYNEILNDFNFSKEMDEKSADLLNEILQGNSYSFNELVNYLNSVKNNKNPNFIIFGAGPSLKSHIKTIKSKINLEDSILISADGATTGLLEENIVPDIVVSDLDGKIEDLLIANNEGSFFIIHGHGNNLDLIYNHVKKFKKVLITTQSTPKENLYNFGGFTDGDRAVFLAIALNAKKIVLAGMDFGKYVTNYSRPNIKSDIELADNIKEKKLKYAEKLIDWAIHNENVEIKFL
jgi:uncharacterized Rossmann fold enzyme